MYSNSSLQGNHNLFVKILLFFINPFWGFLYSLRNPASRSSYVIFFLFGLLFAWVMDYHESDYDICRIISDFYSNKVSIEELTNQFFLFFSGESTYREFYRTFLNSFTRIFSNNYHTLFLFASIPYTYFLLRSMQFLTTDRERFIQSSYCMTILILFVYNYDIFWISNFRFGTAAWISIYSLFQIFYLRNKEYIALLLLTPLVHSSFWFLICLFFIYYLIPIKTKLYKSLRFFFIVSIPFAFIESNLLNVINLDFLPNTLQQWGNGYLSEEEQANTGMYQSGTGYYMVTVVIKKIQLASYILGVLFLIYKGRLESLEGKNKKFVFFFLFFFSIMNFCQIIPTLGERFMNIAKIFFVFFWFKLMHNSKYKKYIYVVFVASLFQLLYFNLRQYINVLDSDFLWYNALALIIKSYGVSSYYYF